MEVSGFRKTNGRRDWRKPRLRRRPEEGQTEKHATGRHIERTVASPRDGEDHSPEQLRAGRSDCATIKDLFEPMELEDLHSARGNDVLRAEDDVFGAHSLSEHSSPASSVNGTPRHPIQQGTGVVDSESFMRNDTPLDQRSTSSRRFSIRSSFKNETITSPEEAEEGAGENSSNDHPRRESHGHDLKDDKLLDTLSEIQALYDRARDGMRIDAQKLRKMITELREQDVQLSVERDALEKAIHEDKVTLQQSNTEAKQHIQTKKSLLQEISEFYNKSKKASDKLSRERE